MAEHLDYQAPADRGAPYASVEELREEHTVLLRRRRSGFHDGEAALLEEIETFLRRGYATGAVLGDTAERYAAQGMLTYWSNMLYRAGRELADGSLADYDPSLAPRLDAATCPYLSLGELPEGRAGQLASWQRLVREGLQKLQQQGLVAIVGASGSGRTTLVRGGLLPALSKEGPDDQQELWCPLPLVPGENPLADLLRYLLPAADPAAERERLAQLRTDPAHLARLLEASPSRPAVLIVEKFEQLFARAPRADVQVFADSLLALAGRKALRHGVVLMARPDCLSQVATLGEFGQAFRKGQVLMAFTSAELRQMIEEPAKGVGLHIDEWAVDRLLLDVQGDPAALTLLQFTLLLLWDHREGNRISPELYDRWGGGRLAVARQAEGVYQTLTAEEQKAFKRILMALVQPDARGGVVCQGLPRERLYPKEGPREVTDRILDKLLAARLLRKTPGPHPGGYRLDVVHEAVATAWPLGVEWLDEARNRRRWQLRLRTAAEKWDEQRRNTGVAGRLPPALQRMEPWVNKGLDLWRNADTLWRGATLEQAIADAEQAAGTDEELKGLDKEFLEASREADKWRKRKGMAFAVLGGLALGAIVALLFWLQLERERAAKAEANERAERERAKTLLAEQHRTQLELTMSRWSTAEGLRLVDGGDASGALLLFVEAWERLQNSKGDTNDERIRQLEKDYQLRLANTRSQLPDPVGLAHHEGTEASAFSADGRWAVTGGGKDAKSLRLWELAKGPKPVLDQTLAQLLRVPDADTASARLVNYACFSPKGDYAAISLGAKDKPGWTLILDTNDAPNGGKIKALAHAGRAMLAAFSPDGKLLATVVDSPQGSEIKVWNVPAWQPAWASAWSFPGEVRHVAFCPKTERFVAAGVVAKDRRGLCREWDLKDRAREPIAYELERSANHAAFSPDGKWLAIAGGEGEERGELWLSTERGKQQELFPCHLKPVAHVAFRPGDGCLLVSASQDGTARLWALSRDGKADPASLHGELPGQSWLYQANFSPDGRYLVTAGRDRRARVWNVDTRRLVQSDLYHGGTVSQAAFTDDGLRVVTAGEMVLLWGLPKSDPPLPLEPNRTVHLLTADPERRRVVLATASTDRKDKEAEETDQTGWIHIWDAWTERFVTPGGLAHPCRVSHAALNADGNQLVTVCEDGLAYLWDLRTPGAARQPLRRDPKSVVTYATFSPDGRLVTFEWNREKQQGGVLSVWDVTSPGKAKVDRADQTFGAPVTLAVFHKDRLATAHAEKDKGIVPGEVRVWRVPAGRPAVLEKQLASEDLATGAAHKEPVLSLAFSPDGKALVTAGADDYARVWDLESGRGRALIRRTAEAEPDAPAAKREAKTHTADVVFVAFGPKGHSVVTASRDGSAIVWDVRDFANAGGKLVTRLEHKAPVNYAALSADERYVVTASRDGLVRVSAVQDGQAVAVRKHAGEVVHAGFLGADQASTIFTLSYHPADDVAGESQAGPASQQRRLEQVWHAAVNEWTFDAQAAPTREEVERLRRYDQVRAGRRLHAEKGELSALIPVPADELFRLWSNRDGR